MSAIKRMLREAMEWAEYAPGGDHEAKINQIIDHTHPAAWRYQMKDGRQVIQTKYLPVGTYLPFGTPGQNFSETFKVKETPLYD